MSGRLFVHIGLPKTATTTLQIEFFPGLAGDRIHYLGVRQPRSEQQQDALYTRCIDAVWGQAPVEPVRAGLRDRLDRGDTLILSEEMFTVSQETLPWRVKLRNLSGLLQGLDYQLILTVREPVAALFSYYVERYAYLPRLDRPFLAAAREDEYMHIFHYGKLIDEILQHFEHDRLFVKRFEDIVAGDLDDLSRLITAGSRQWGHAVPARHNDKTRVGDVVFTGNSLTLVDYGRRIMNALGIMQAGWVVRLKHRLRPLVSRLDRITLSKKRVVRPSEQEMDALRAELAPETAALAQHFGIRYD